MPYYRFNCENEECETEVFEVKRKIDDRNDPAQCPQCEAECNRINNDFCMASPVLKGDGWFRNSYQKMTPIGNVMRRSDSKK